jgi:sugar phosphate permease
MKEKANISVSKTIANWQKKMFWLMWVTYASFYLC